MKVPMRTRISGLLAAFAAGLALFGSPSAVAQRTFYRVYQYETPLAGWLEANLWTTYVPGSDLPYTKFGKDLMREGLVAHSVELEYGVTDHFTIGAYANAEDPRGGAFKLSETRLVGRYRFAQRYEHFFNTAAYLEYYMPRGGYSNSHEVEARLILDHDFNDFRLALNPTLSKSIHGDEGGQRVKWSFENGLYWRRYRSFQPGIEIYSDFGEIGKTPAFNKQTHVLFATADIRVGTGWQWNVGVGRGLTSASDHWTVKSILTYQFNAIRPSSLFR